MFEFWNIWRLFVQIIKIWLKFLFTKNIAISCSLCITTHTWKHQWLAQWFHWKQQGFLCYEKRKGVQPSYSYNRSNKTVSFLLLHKHCMNFRMMTVLVKLISFCYNINIIWRTDSIFNQDADSRGLENLKQDMNMNYMYISIYIPTSTCCLLDVASPFGHTGHLLDVTTGKLTCCLNCR